MHLPTNTPNVLACKQQVVIMCGLDVRAVSSFNSTARNPLDLVEKDTSKSLPPRAQLLAFLLRPATGGWTWIVGGVWRFIYSPRGCARKRARVRPPREKTVPALNELLT